MYVMVMPSIPFMSTPSSTTVTLVEYHGKCLLFSNTKLLTANLSAIETIKNSSFLGVAHGFDGVMLQELKIRKQG